jgi:hypothetical protein
MGVWSSKPDRDEPLGRISWTWYHEDFRTKVGTSLTDPNEGTAITYFKDGPFYVADYVIDKPGGYIQQAKLRVYVYIWEG